MTRSKRAFFHLDVLFAVLLLLSTVLLCVSVLGAESKLVAREAKAVGEGELLLSADVLLKKCADEGGLAVCRSGFLLSHVVEDDARVLGLEEEKEKGFCVGRLVLSEGLEERILRVCGG